MILFVGQTPVSGIDDIHRLLTKDVIGKKLDLVLLREGELVETSIVPGENPD